MTIQERWSTDSFTFSICLSCKHYIGKAKCEAFTDGIPESILSGQNDHSKPLPEQENEIVFEKL
jgi:hypothetical protein